MSEDEWNFGSVNERNDLPCHKTSAIIYKTILSQTTKGK